MAKTFLPANQVGSPWEIFSQAPGKDRQMRRTRSIWSSFSAAAIFSGRKQFYFVALRRKFDEPLESHSNLSQEFPGRFVVGRSDRQNRVHLEHISRMLHYGIGRFKGVTLIPVSR